MADFPAAETATLALLDRVAVRMVAAAAPMQFRIAHTAAEREAIFRLRYRVVVERGWARPEDFPDGLERDAYDDTAVQIGGWDGDTLNAAGRLVFPTPGCPLPTEDAFNLAIEPRGRVADLGRDLSVRRDVAGRRRAFWGIIGCCWQEVRAHGLLHVCGVFSPTVQRLYRRMGFAVIPLAPPRRYWGEDRQPVVVDVLASAPALTRTFGSGLWEA